MRNKKIVALSENLTSHGFSDYEEIYSILNKLTEKELDSLTYAMYRTAEKSGLDYFSTNEIDEDDLPF